MSVPETAGAPPRGPRGQGHGHTPSKRTLTSRCSTARSVKNRASTANGSGLPPAPRIDGHWMPERPSDTIWCEGSRSTRRRPPFSTCSTKTEDNEGRAAGTPRRCVSGPALGPLMETSCCTVGQRIIDCITDCNSNVSLVSCSPILDVNNWFSRESEAHWLRSHQTSTFSLFLLQTPHGSRLLYSWAGICSASYA